jgi:Fe-S oxidoreductase
MCPSYMATLEEEHSTRGRAHMLFEMLQGEVIGSAWKNDHVKQALDLCLSCKACKSECPTNVDIATYRAEFLSHYFEHARRPLRAYAFGMIDRWARLGAIAPRVANALGHAPGAKGVLRRALSLAREREVPRLAPISFRQWARRRGTPAVGDDRERGVAENGSTEVILWLDTFNNYFCPQTSRAALDVLTRAGFRVAIPRDHLCCGRPLYDFGFLDHARQYLQRILHALGPAIDAGRSVVVLEPSCASVFRDELRNLFPDDRRAERLRRQTFLLSEFLEHHAPGYAPPRLGGTVLLHGHCHHKALMKMTDEESLLRKMGVALQSIDAGCCGMAGPFGFMADTFAVSQAIGERVLLPAVRRAPADAFIVSDGFSCREQIAQATGRRALHLAEVMQLALR